ncbi:MAG TPA: 30S ribosome-binding factor RbfA [Actinomycetota bacterium]|nr:30S ribosome-binding factor RbfA [Actinomycetota bacterium]
MANPSYPRSLRLAETIKRLVGEWVEAEQADGRLGFVTVTDVRVTGDLRHATVYWTALGDQPDQESADAALRESTGQARSFVAGHVRLRYTPTLEFHRDDLPEHSARIDRLLAEIGSNPDHGGEAAAPEGRQP